MADDFKVQVNLKLGETLINLRGQSVSEVAAMVTEINGALDAIGEAMSLAKQVVTAKGLTSFQPAPAGATSAPSTQHSAPAAGATSGALRCKHGAYKDFNGKTKKNGDGYQYRYYCAAPYKQGGNPDQCKAQDLPGQEAWVA